MNRMIYKYHPTIGYTYIPNLKTRVNFSCGGFLVKSNNWGFRSDWDYENRKKNNKIKRILFFGDSHTAGYGVSNKKRFTDIIANKLEDQVEVYNFGIPGTGTDQQYLAFKEFAKNIECDLIVLVVMVENIRRVNSQFRYYLNDNKEQILYQKPYFKIVESEQLQLCNVPVIKHSIPPESLSTIEKKTIASTGKFPALRKFINRVGVKESVQSITGFQPLPEYNKSNGSAWLLLKNIIKEWSEEVNCDFLVVPQPLYHYIEEKSNPTKYLARFKELSGELEINIHNPLPDYLKYSKEERRQFRFPIDQHPTTFGHKAIASSLIKPINNILNIH